MDIQKPQINYQQIQDPIIRDNFMKLSILLEQLVDQVNKLTKDIEEGTEP